MKISEQWLREWVSPKLGTAALADKLTHAGLEVGAIEPVAPNLASVVVGEIVSLAPHAQADKLRVCQVSIGKKGTLQIVCGAPNAAVGLKAPLALVGATLTNGVVVQKTQVRGIDSYGMLCSAAELGLENDSAGLYVLEKNAQVGQTLVDYLQANDHTLELELTPNRGDCLSVRGTAREIAGLTGAKLKTPKPKTVKPASSRRLTVKLLSPRDCPLYVGRVIENISPATQTPRWMKERLRRAGVRSLHPVVDVTNYVMLELGQPMHAFDFEKLKGGIDVRRAKPGERLSMLDGREAALQPDMLLIADQSGPVALAGIMGGAPSAVSERTQHLFLESAWFSPNAVAGRARALGLHTESSQRFERGVDPELARTAMERATDLIVRIVGGKPGPVVEVKKNAALPKHKPIVLRAARIAKILGHAIPASVIMVILKRLNFRVAKKAKHFEVTAPSWRFDIEHEVDLIEEIARVHGYEKLTARRPTQAMRALPISESKNSLARFRTVLIDRDYQEIITYSFVDPHLQALLDTHAHAIRLANPISADMAEMRLSLLPGLLKTIQYNQNRQLDRLRFFETGRVFVGEGKVTQQPIRLGAAVTGNVWPTQWGAPVRTVDFFDAKADLEALLTLTGLENEFRFEPYPHPALHPGQCARLLYKAEPVGWVGMLHPAVQNKLDLKRPVAVFEVEIGALTSARTPRFSEISKFPAIRRDLAFELAREIPAQKVLDTAKKAAGNLLVNLELFDEYRGEGIDPLRKSLALGLTFQDFSRTLKENEIEALTARIVAVLVSELGAKLRGAAV